MNAEVLACDTAEFYKGSIHLALFALASICAAYNAGAVLLRPTDPRLLLNTLTYAGLAAFEARQVKRHWSALPDLQGEVMAC